MLRAAACMCWQTDVCNCYNARTCNCPASDMVLSHLLQLTYFHFIYTFPWAPACMLWHRHRLTPHTETHTHQHSAGQGTELYDRTATVCYRILS